MTFVRLIRKAGDRAPPRDLAEVVGGCVSARVMRMCVIADRKSSPVGGREFDRKTEVRRWLWGRGCVNLSANGIM